MLSRCIKNITITLVSVHFMVLCQGTHEIKPIFINISPWIGRGVSSLSDWFIADVSFMSVFDCSSPLPLLHRRCRSFILPSLPPIPSSTAPFIIPPVTDTSKCCLPDCLPGCCPSRYILLKQITIAFRQYLSIDENGFAQTLYDTRYLKLYCIRCRDNDICILPLW